MSLISLNFSCLTRMMDFASSSFFDININLCSQRLRDVYFTIYSVKSTEIGGKV